MLMLTNDLNERDAQIVALKASETALKTALAQKEKMYEQDALVRMQLGKKLEQVLMDKEDAMEQLELMTVCMFFLLFTNVCVVLCFVLC